MTKEEKAKAIGSLKISAPVRVMTWEEFGYYIQTINQIIDWLEQEPTTENGIDRAELLKAMDTWDKFGYTTQYRLERLDKDDKSFVPYVKYDDMVKCVKGMPSVTPIRPKGHWILRNSFLVPYKCSECNYESERYDNYCPNCGADMRGNTIRKGEPIEGNNESYNCENWIP